MAKNTLWKGVQVQMMSAVALAKPIESVTQANPGVVGIDAHGYANGDYLRFRNIQGMYELNDRVFRAAGSLADSFNIGEDTTAYEDFVSGDVEKITFGYSFSTMLDINVSGGEAAEEDFTTIHNKQRVVVPSIASALVMTSSNKWDVSDPALIAASGYSKKNTEVAFLFTFEDGQKFVFSGYISCTLSPGGAAQSKVTTPIKITASGLGTTYPS